MIIPTQTEMVKRWLPVYIKRGYPFWLTYRQLFNRWPKGGIHA